MRNKERIKLEKERKEDMVKAIMSYFKEERGEEIGHLAAGMILDLSSRNWPRSSTTRASRIPAPT